MVCSSTLIAGFQPALPTACRCKRKVWMRVSSLRKWVCMSIMNCPESAFARSLAISGVAASACETPKIGP